MSRLKTNSLEEALGTVAILHSITELGRSTGGKGLIAAFSAAGKFVGLLFAFLLGGAALASIVGGVIAVVVVFAAAIYYAYYKRPPKRLDPPIDERQIVETTLRTAHRFLNDEDVKQVELATTRGGFYVVIDTRRRQSLSVNWSEASTLELTLTVDGDLAHEHAAHVNEAGDHATDIVDAELEGWLLKTLSRYMPERAGAPTSPVRLVRADPLDAPGEPGAIEFETGQHEVEPPSRLAAAAAYHLFNILFRAPVALLTVATLLTATASISFNPGIMTANAFAAGVILFCCGYVIDKAERPARTMSRDSLPLEASTRFTLAADGMLSSHLVEEPRDRVQIDLTRPFAATFTRSVEGVEPVTTTLEIRSGRTRLRVSARLSGDTPEDVLDQLEPWGASAQTVEAEHFVGLVRGVEFYAQAAGKPLRFRATLPSADFA